LIRRRIPNLTQQKQGEKHEYSFEPPLFIVHHNPPESFKKLQTKKNCEMSRANKNPSPSSNVERPPCRNNGNYKHRLNAQTSSSLQIPRIVVPRRIQQQEQATITIQKQEEKRI
jgi:hypothetical protein